MTKQSYGDEFAVVTVTYSPGDVLDAFLDTLTKATASGVRVVLADNGSTDGAPERAAAKWRGADEPPVHDRQSCISTVELLRIGENLGYGGAANRAVAALPPEVGWVLVSNPDIEFSPGSVDDLLATAKRWPRGGSFGPLIKETSGAVYPSARSLPSLGRGIGHALLGKVWRSNPWTRAYTQEQTSITERTAGWLSGSCLLVRREAFDSVGGFDARYFMYFEDVDLGDRLGRAGWLNVYVPSAEVTHIGGHATRRSSARMLAEHHRSAYRYLADRHRGPVYAPLRLALRAGLAVRRTLEVRSAGRRAVAKPTS